MKRWMLVVIVCIVPLLADESSPAEVISSEPVIEEVVVESETADVLAEADTPSEAVLPEHESTELGKQESESLSFDLEAHLKEIKESKGDERRVLMNQLKTELKAMNKEKRSMVLKSLRSFGQGEQTQRRQGEQLQQGMQQQRQQQQRGNGQHLQRGQP